MIPLTLTLALQLTKLDVKPDDLYKGTVEYHFKDDEEEIDMRYIDDVEYRVTKVGDGKIEIDLKRVSKSLWLDGKPAATGFTEDWSHYKVVRSDVGNLVSLDGPSQDLYSDARLERLILLAAKGMTIPTSESLGGAAWTMVFDPKGRRFTGSFTESTLDRPYRANFSGEIDERGWVTELAAHTLSAIPIPGSEDERAKLSLKVKVSYVKPKG
ncbi:MAG: hypothetical protein HONBIEJF_02420 [Fimbriimonadaceae bacterium]|nr:hypothetical protein [Fimbriimonadaceae bacterium]